MSSEILWFLKLFVLGRQDPFLVWGIAKLAPGLLGGRVIT